MATDLLPFPSSTDPRDRVYLCARRRPALTLVSAWVATALIAGRAHAEGEPTGRAAHWLPLTATSLVMKSQSAEFQFEPSAHAWSVSVRSELQQPSDAAGGAQLQLAIPEFGCEAESEFEDACDPARSGFAQLAVSVDGRAEALKKSRPKGALATDPQPNALWILPLRLQKGETRVLEQRYVVPAGESGEGGFSASYLLRGGKLWGKPFGRTTFKFSIPAHSCLVVEPEGMPRKSRRVVLRDDALWLELVYEAYVYTPPRDLNLYFEPCIAPRDTQMPGCSVSGELARHFYPPEEGEEAEALDEAGLRKALAPLSADELARCRDGVFAAYAAYYQQGELTKLPTPDAREAARNYTAPLLTAEDWAWVHFLDAVLAERSKVAAPAPQPKAAEPAAQPRGCGCQLAPAPAPSALWLVGLWLIGACAARRRRRAPHRQKKVY